MKKLLLKILTVVVFTFAFTASASAVEYFISPTGNDSLDGTSEVNAIATFEHSYTIMSPGDTLTLLDGTYDQQLLPPTNLSGSEGNYTTFRAQNIGQAVIAPNDESDFDSSYDTASLFIYSNTSRGRMGYLHFDGLFVKGFGERNAIGVWSMDEAELNEMSHNIKITNCGAQGSGYDENATAPIEIMGSIDILVEDGYAFGFGRKAMEIYGAMNVTVRRMIVRYDWWEGGAYKPNDPRVDIACYNTIDSTFENILVFDSGPTPNGLSSDRVGLSASGNDAPGTAIQGSHNVEYLGSMVFNNLNSTVNDTYNGIEIDGGTGDPAYDITFRDVVIWDSESYGVNMQGNVDDVYLDQITIANSGLTGVRVNVYSSYPISNIHMTKILSRDNGDEGFWRGAETIEFTNNTATRNAAYGSDIEPEYEPTITHLPAKVDVAGYERGADIAKRYVDRVKTTESLWPWTNEELIKSHMCSTEILDALSVRMNNYNGTSISYAPGWCATNKTLTEYVWEYLGNDCPEDICGTASSEIRADVNQDGNINTADAQLTLRNSLGLSMTGTAWVVSDTTGDVNCDDITNTADAQLILRYSLGLDMTPTQWCVD